MKNIAHFASGLAVASFIPGAMQDAAQGSLLIALGGLCAMLPDVLDFRLARHLERHDADIVPDPRQPDPQAIADAISAQVELALSLQQSRVIQLHPVRQQGVEWVLYRVEFDSVHQDIVVRLDTGNQEARSHVGRILCPYENSMHIEELGGPSLRLSPQGGGVLIEPLPWHRSWSHSFFLSLVIGVIAGCLFGPYAGIIAGLGYGVHVLEDQLGFLGSALFFPFISRRIPGLGLMHSGEAIPNILTIWISMALLLVNMDRTLAYSRIQTGPFLAFGVGLPAVLLLWIHARRQWHKHLDQESQSVVVDQLQDTVSEAEEYRV